MYMLKKKTFLSNALKYKNSSWKIMEYKVLHESPEKTKYVFKKDRLKKYFYVTVLLNVARSR